MTNGVVQEQFNNCSELSTTSPATPAPVSLAAATTTTPLSPTDGNSLLEDANAVKSQMRSLPAPEAAAEQELDIVINNVVCSFSLGCHLNLRTIALNGHNVEYRRESGMVTMKLRKPSVTASVWSSGKITCTGATSEDEATIGARRIARVIQKLGFNAKFRKWRIVNVLGSCSMPFEIKINAFSQQHREAEYEPELHPGVTYKLKDPKATLKIFSTGSITVTAPSVPNVQHAIEHIYPLVSDFRKDSPIREELLRKRAMAGQLLNQEKVKRKRPNSCSSNEEEDKEVESIMTR